MVEIAFTILVISLFFVPAYIQWVIMRDQKREHELFMEKLRKFHPKKEDK